MTTRRAGTGRLTTLSTIAIAAAAFAIAPSAASAWAPAGSAAVHPGIQTYTKGAQCTANFVFKRRGATYLGQAAHCQGTGSSTETNGCKAGSLPLGTKVRLEGANTKGRLTYSSWIAMHKANEKDKNTCAYNDLALIKLKSDDVNRTNPSVPSFGGPKGVGAAKAGDTVYTYGNSSLRPGGVPHEHQGPVLARRGGGWSYTVNTVPTGVPGDSGSAFLNEDGAALGILSTLDVGSCGACNGVGSLAKELRYARHHGLSKLHVVNGTEAFSPGSGLALGH
jgi:V8-like Glu-specific endopeptidase